MVHNERLLPLAFCSILIIKNDQMEQIIFTDINLNPIIAHLNLNSLEIMIRTSESNRTSVYSFYFLEYLK